MQELQENTKKPRKINKIRESFIDLESLDQENREEKGTVSRNFEDFFEKIKEIKQKREVFEELDEEIPGNSEVFVKKLEEIDKKHKFSKENTVSQRVFTEKVRIFCKFCSNFEKFSNFSRKSLFFKRKNT